MSTTVPPTFLPQTSAPPRSAATLMRDRVLVAAGCDNAMKLASAIHHERSGLIVTGATALAHIRSLREAHPNMLLIAEPGSHEHYSTEGDPFIIPVEDGQLFAPSLEEIVTGQRDAGADVVLLPAGYIVAGAEAIVRAVIEQASKISGDDIVVPLYLDEGWLKAEHVKFLRAAIDRSDHPVALAFGSRKNPLAGEKRLLAYRELFAPGKVVRIAWRTDFAGIDAMIGGAHAAVMGVLPSQRRLTPPTEKGNARNPRDPSPYIIIPDALHFKKAGAMRTELFAGEPAPVCVCVVCDGRVVDRFTKDHAIEAALHNLAMLDKLLEDVLSADGADRRMAWGEALRMSLLVHADIARRVGRPFNPPQDVMVWAESMSITAEAEAEENTNVLN